MLTLSAILDEILLRAAQHPQRVALQEVGGRRMTFGQLGRDVRAVAAGLVDEGMRPGTVVLFTVPPSVASLTLILALVRVGATIVAADPRMGAAIFGSRNALAKPSWVFATSPVYAVSSHPLGRIVARRFGIELPRLADLPARHVRVGPRLPGTPRSLSLEQLRAADPASATSVLGDGARIVIFTSGTTGAPKAVVHDERSLGASLQMVLEHSGFTDGDRLLSNDLYLNVPALMVGATSFIPGFGRFAPRRWVDALRASRATVASGVPSEMLQVVDHLAARGERLPDTLRLLLLGGAPAHRTFLERLQAVVAPSTAVWSIYAMTEILPVCAVSLEEKLAARSDGGDLLGRPFAGVRVSTNDAGELVVAGPNLFRGYLGEDGVTEHATGDLGAVDAQGRVVLFGRRKEMLIRGRDNIYPSLVESIVDSIPGVRRSCLCGYYDERRADERVVLAIEPVDGERPDELIRRVRRRIAAGPTRIDAGAMPDRIVVMQLPIDARSRKIDRAAVVGRVLGMAT